MFSVQFWICGTRFLTNCFNVFAMLSLTTPTRDTTTFRIFLNRAGGALFVLFPETAEMLGFGPLVNFYVLLGIVFALTMDRVMYGV